MVKLRLLNSLLLIAVLATAGFAGTEQAGTSGAAFLKLGQSVRAAGLGGSFAALADDPSAIFYNPAGLQLSGNNRFSFTQSSWLIGSSYSTLCFTRPLGLRDTLGIALSYMNFGAIQETTASFRTGTGREFTPGSILAVLSVAKDIGSAFIGVNAKLLRQNIDSFQEEGVGLDLGLLTRTPLERLRLGLSLLNIGWTGDKALPQTLLVGLNYEISGNLVLISDLRLPRDAAAVINLGLEYKTLPFLTLRGGVNTRNVEGAGGNFSLGLGLNFAGLNLDYAYVPYADLGETHRIGISLEY